MSRKEWRAAWALVLEPVTREDDGQLELPFLDSSNKKD